MCQIRDGWMVFDDWSNEPLSNVVFPTGIQKIRFGRVFNQNVSQLPNSLTHLIFGWKFNQDMRNALPNSIIHLTFGYCFNKDVSNLPNSITYLTFGRSFNQDVSNLPNSITHLIFDWKFNQDTRNLPNSLTYLKFGYCFNQNISKLPKSITYLKFSGWIDSKFNHNLNPYLYHLTDFYITDSHKQKRLMVERCQTNTHNISIREDKLIDLLLKN